MPLKGETLSLEAIEKMKQSKLSQLLSKYNWVIAEPYLDQEINNGSVERKNKYITLRQFKDNILLGKSIQEMIDDGVSKKVVQFFSNFCQGKITLTKEDFIKSYEIGESLEKISDKFNVSREDITYLRQLYDIKRKGATYINRKKTEVPLTQRQKEILYGSLMGDAKRQHTQSYSSAGFGQCESQKDYLMWKYLEYANIVSENSLRFNEDVDKRSGGRVASYRFYTLANSDVEIILKIFYRDGKKCVNNDILNNLTALSVAIWHMDDGSVSWKKEDIEKGWNSKPEIRLCTDSFSVEEVEMIIKWFKEKYDINTHWRYHRKNKSPRIIIDADSADRYFSLIRPHIIPSMLYKVDYEAWKKFEKRK